MSNIYDKSSLVLIPSGTKTGKVYSQKPVSGDGDFTFTRSSAATRVNADGFIEKETQNLLLQSNQFDTSWVNVSTTETGGQADKDGGNTAWKLQNTATAGRIQQGNFSAGVYTMSVYAKAGDVNWIQLYADETTTGNDPTCYFDLQNGVVGTSTYIIDKNIESVGGGWYRCSMSFNAIGTFAYLIFNSQDDNVRANSGEFTYIQDAQLGQGLVARDYIETTTTAVEGGITDNVPRLDYTDSSCPALLLEPQRTNLLENSEYFGAWIPSGVSIALGSLDSPTGDANAYVLTQSGTGYGSIYKSITTTSGTTYTASVYAKKGNQDYLGLEIRVSGYQGLDAVFDLNTGTLDSGTGTIEDAGNGWYRCSISAVSLGGSPLFLIGRGISGAIGDTLYLYGAQFEAGNYATSYIPTYGSSVTRVADGLITLSDLANISQGTMFLELDGQANRDSDFRFQLTRNTGESSNRIFLAYSGNSKARIYCISNGSIQADLNSSTIITSGAVKIAVTFKENDIRLFLNGVKTNDDTTASIPTGLDEIILGVGTATGGVATKDMLRQALLFPTALSDQEAIDLTTI